MLSYYHHFLINKRHPIEFQLCVLSFFNKSPSTRIIFHLDRNDLYLIKLINFIILFRFKHFTNKVSSSTCLWAVSIQFLYGNLIWFIFIAIHVIRLARIPFRFSWITLIHSLSSIFHFFLCKIEKNDEKWSNLRVQCIIYFVCDVMRSTIVLDHCLICCRQQYTNNNVNRCNEMQKGINVGQTVTVKVTRTSHTNLPFQFW